MDVAKRSGFTEDHTGVVSGCIRFAPMAAGVYRVYVCAVIQQPVNEVATRQDLSAANASANLERTLDEPQKQDRAISARIVSTGGQPHKTSARWVSTTGKDRKENALLGRLSGGSLGEDGLERHREVQVGLWQFKVDPCRLRGQTLVRVVVEHVLVVAQHRSSSFE